MFGEIMWLFVCLARHAWSVQLNNTIARDVYFTISLTFLLLRDLFISFIDTSDAIVLSQKKFVSQKQQCNCPQRVFIPVLGHRIFLHGTRTAKPLNTKKKTGEKIDLIEVRCPHSADGKTTLQYVLETNCPLPILSAGDDLRL